MAEHMQIALSDLLIDAENPRLGKPSTGQREAQRAIASQQKGKLLVLARDIAQHGLNPADLPIVMPFDRGRYVVLEGNRRLTAVRALENPDSFVDAVAPNVLKELRRLSRRYQESPVEEIECLVVSDRDEAQHWIELRHTGQNQGAGVVGWASDEISRFRARSGQLPAHTQALDFLEYSGQLDYETRRKVPATSLKRMLHTPEVREKLGVDVQGGRLMVRADEARVAKALKRVVSDLANQKIKVRDIYTADQRKAYINGLPKGVTVRPTQKGTPTSSAAKRTKTTKNRTQQTSPKKRDRLIPQDCALSIEDERIRNIENELRRLSLENYTNAVSVLFRVFMELSVDQYIATNQLSMTAQKITLGVKIRAVANDLKKHSKLTDAQARPVMRACQKNAFLAPSVDLMHDYVHNQHVFPVPGDLREHWNNLQPFVVAMWS